MFSEQGQKTNKSFSIVTKSYCDESFCFPNSYYIKALSLCVAIKVNLTDNAATREAKLCDAEAELARSAAHCARLLQVQYYLNIYPSIVVC